MLIDLILTFSMAFFNLDFFTVLCTPSLPSSWNSLHIPLSTISLSPCREASVFLQRGPQRIGSVYKKAVYKQYSDATYRTGVAKPEWLGYLGPLLMAEQGDTVLIHLRNAASRPYSIHPHGLNYSKSSEGESWSATRWLGSAWLAKMCSSRFTRLVVYWWIY